MLCDHWHQKGEPYHYLGHDGSTGGLCRAVEQAKNLPSKCVDGRQVFNWANEGDPTVCEVLDAYTYCLAMHFNLQSLFDPDVIAIGGGISAQPILFQYIKRNLDYLKHHLPMYLVIPKVVRCQFMNDANLIGALKNYLQHTDVNTAFEKA